MHCVASCCNFQSKKMALAAIRHAAASIQHMSKSLVATGNRHPGRSGDMKPLALSRATRDGRGCCSFRSCMRVATHARPTAVPTSTENTRSGQVPRVCWYPNPYSRRHLHVARAASSQATATAGTWRQQACAVLKCARLKDAQQAFAVTGHMDDMPFAAATSIQVTGLWGQLQLPISEQHMAALLAVGEPAPFGSGMETVLDPAVRKATQIEAARVQTNDIWQQQMQQLTARVAKGLGVDEHVQVEARPYKLLIYTEGGHFKAHRDTEKEPGMFDTLVVQLPVVGGHQGGDFAFHHNSKSINWRTEVDSSSRFQYAAFYADVEHELQPITSGARVVLVYSLVRAGTSQLPQPVDASPLVQQMRDAVARWEQELVTPGRNAPDKLYVPLDHRYTQASLSFDALKGMDAKMVSCLTHPDVGLEVHVGLMVKTKVGQEYDDDKEVYHEVDGCIHFSGARPCQAVVEHLELPAAAWSARHLLRPTCTVHQPDEAEDRDDQTEEEEEEEAYDEDDNFERSDANYTGNECTSVHHIYRQGMVAIWPRSRTAAMLGTKEFLPALYLLDLRLLNGSDTEIDTALSAVMDMYQKFMQARKEAAEKGSWSCSLYISESEIAEALMVVSKLPPATAVPAMVTLLQGLGGVGHGKLQTRYGEFDNKFPDNWDWTDQEDSHNLRTVLVDSLLAVGSPDILVTLLVEKVKQLVIKDTIACARLAVEAASKSATLGASIADAVLSETLFADNPQQILGGLPYHTRVCSLAIMLCEVPTHRKHLDAFAAIVASMPLKELTGLRHSYENEDDDEEPRSVLKKILTNLQVKRAVRHSPRAIATMATAYKQQLEKMLLPVPQFSWKMPNVTLPDYPEVQDFFHSTAMSAGFSDCFKDGGDEVKMLKAIGGYPYRESSTYSEYIDGRTDLSARVTGTGLDGVPSVTITKTRLWYNEHTCDARNHNRPFEKMLEQVDDLLKLSTKVAAECF